MGTFTIPPYLASSSDMPADDFEGLTPRQMHLLLYDPYGEPSPLKIRESIDDRTLDAIPFLRLTEEFLKIIQREQTVKLTGTGALPRRVVQELYGHRFIPEEFIDRGIVSLQRERDSIALHTLHIVTELSGTVRKEHNRLFLTKKGKDFLDPIERTALFRKVLSTFTERFNWSYNDRYDVSEVGQLGWAFSVLLLAKFGSVSRPIVFYAEKYKTAFPVLFHSFPRFVFGTREADFAHCYGIRTFARFLEWFGMVKIAHRIRHIHWHRDLVTRSDVCKKVFAFTHLART